jgi:hypothetical protein
MAELNDIQRLISQHQRRLLKLKEKQANWPVGFNPKRAGAVKG